MRRPRSVSVEGGKTTVLVGTAVLGALVVVFDYTLKFSGWKIPFPWLPILKFDFTGIPIVLSLLLYGLRSGATTSAVALLAIVLRSGDLVGASMKALAEFSTIFGMALFRNRRSRVGRVLSFALGLTVRVAIMSVFNLVVLPISITLLPLIGAFNVVAGSISMFGGYLIHEAMVRRALLKTSATASRLSFESGRH
jgi:riboflavin transporter FmnP